MTPPIYPQHQGRWVNQNDPQLFETLRKHTLTHLQGTLARVLGKADDWLFDLAQKEGASAGAPSLEAMRVLRLSRNPLEQAYTRHFDTGFEEFSVQPQAVLARPPGVVVVARNHELDRDAPAASMGQHIDHAGVWNEVRIGDVQMAAGALQRAGLINYSRGNVTIKNRRGLERRACECYGIAKREFDRLLGGKAGRRPALK